MVTVTHSVVDTVGQQPRGVRQVRVRLRCSQPTARVYRRSDGAEVDLAEHVMLQPVDGVFPASWSLPLAANDTLEPEGTWYEVHQELVGGPGDAAFPPAPAAIVVPDQPGPYRLVDLMAVTPRTEPWVVGWMPSGPWTSTKTYHLRDVVTFAGSSYLARQQSVGVEPGSDDAVWQVAAERGPEGPIGPPGGPPGPTGPAGPQGVQGPAGRTFDPEGTQPTKAALAALPTPAKGKAWVVTENKHLYVYEGNEAPTSGQPGYDAALPGWTDLGDISGVQGVQGVQGVKGDPGASGGDLPEYSPAAQTAPVSPATDLVGKTARFSPSSALTQPLPLATAGRQVAFGQDGGAGSLTLQGQQRTDTATVTSGSATVQDTAIQAADQGRLVTGTGIPAGSYVGTVTAGTSFLLSSSPTSQVNVNATAAATSVALSDLIGSGVGTTFALQGVGHVVELHCTTVGRWRVIRDARLPALLDGLYVARAQRGPLGGVQDLGNLASGATVSIAAGTYSAAKGVLNAGPATLAAQTGGTDHQLVAVSLTASGADRVVTIGAGITRTQGQTATFTILSGKTARFLLLCTGATTADLLNISMQA